MFDLEAYLKEKKRIIDKALDNEIPAENVPPVLLHKAMRYSVFSGGKRLRPIMCLAAAEAVGVPTLTKIGKAALLSSLAVELLHTYTLIHDDLPCMDDDDLRRGKPTCHVVYGEANAVLAGNALQALAFEVLTKVVVPPPYPPNQLVVELAHAAGSHGVVGGQVEDIAVHDKPTIDIVEYVHLHKTADLFRTAARMGGMAGGAGKREMEALTEYGMNLGLAFQIADDLIDAGAANNKKRHEKMTCLSVYSADAARKKAEILVGKAITALDRFENIRKEPLVAIVRYAVERKY